MQLYQIRYFLAICEAGSFTKAAAQCHVAQPSLTRGLRKLEAEFGGALFHRDQKSCALTALGSKLKPYFEELAGTVEAALDAAQRSAESRDTVLRFGLMCTLGPSLLQPFLSALRVRFPNVDLRLLDAPGEDLIEGLRKRRLDACIVAMPKYPRNALAFPLYEERYLISFAKGHRFEAMAAVPLAELEDESYLSRLSCELRGRVSAFAEGAPPPNVKTVYESNQEQWIQCLIALGLGCAVHPETMPVAQGICQRPLSQPDLKRQVSIVIREDQFERPLLRHILRLAQRHSWR